MRVLTSCRIDQTEAIDLFDMMFESGCADGYEDESLSCDEFLGACLKLKGEARARDAHVISVGRLCVHDVTTSRFKKILNHNNWYVNTTVTSITTGMSIQRVEQDSSHMEATVPTVLVEDTVGTVDYAVTK